MSIPAATRTPIRRLSLTLALATLPVAGGCELFRPASAPAEQASSAPAVQIRSQERLDKAAGYSESGDTAAALAELARAIQDNPRLTQAYLSMGEIHRQTGNYEAMESAYAQATRVEPNNFDAVYGHGLALQLLNRVTEAIREYIRALQIKPNDRDANLNLATAYLQLGEAQQALPYARRAVEVDVEHGPGRVNLGAVYAALNRHREAVLEFEAAANRMDLTPELLLNMADSLGKIGRYREMANTLDRLVAERPTAAAWERLGYARFKLAEYGPAINAFRASTALDPRYFPALNGEGVTLLNQWLLGNRADDQLRRDGMAALRRSVQIKPDQPRIVELLSRYN
ncbi:MAG: tetratricopeptide repeat protein [Phycisphaerales bacterium]